MDTKGNGEFFACLSVMRAPDGRQILSDRDQFLNRSRGCACVRRLVADPDWWCSMFQAWHFRSSRPRLLDTSVPCKLVEVPLSTGVHHAVRRTDLGDRNPFQAVSHETDPDQQAGPPPVSRSPSDKVSAPIQTTALPEWVGSPQTKHRLNRWSCRSCHRGRGASRRLEPGRRARTGHFLQQAAHDEGIARVDKLVSRHSRPGA